MRNNSFFFFLQNVKSLDDNANNNNNDKSVVKKPLGFMIYDKWTEKHIHVNPSPKFRLSTIAASTIGEFLCILKQHIYIKESHSFENCSLSIVWRLWNGFLGFSYFFFFFFFRFMLHLLIKTQIRKQSHQNSMSPKGFRLMIMMLKYFTNTLGR